MWVSSCIASTCRSCAGSSCARPVTPHLAEDLAQETFVKATRALPCRRGENPAAWRVPAVGRTAGTGARRACRAS
ncbi:sigma factor [Nonomuraea longispora]